MQNQPSSSTNNIAPEIQPETATRRSKRPEKGRRRGTFLAVGAVAAIGAMVGTGFAVQGAVAGQNDRIAETRALTEATDLNIDQLDSHGGILEARAVKAAEDTLTGANDTIVAAQGKTDAAQLAASVAALADYKLLAPERVFHLVDTTAVHTETVRAAVAEADRIAAEAAAQAAAAAAAEEATSSAPSRPAAPSNPTEAQAIARGMLGQYGWGDDQFGCLVELWNHESGWNVYASNPSGAYGIPQALPGSKMSTAGADWETNPATQISWGLGYIAGRYGSPCGAWDTFNSQGWY